MKLQVGNKTITIRKWKGKDKKNFISAINQKELNQNEILDSLVYNAIEENVILNIDEFRYVLAQIRAYSIGPSINMEFYCEHCGTFHKKDIKINDIFKPSGLNPTSIKTKEHEIELGEPANKEIYIEKLSEDMLYDFLLRVNSIDGNNAFTLDELVDIFDDIDIDELTEIMDQWESKRFKVDDIVTVTCPNCSTPTIYKFDEVPGFFPEDWIK